MDDKHDAKVTANLTAVSYALFMLIKNAAQAIQNERISETNDSEHAGRNGWRIEVLIVVDFDKFDILISNNGPPIPRDILDRISEVSFTTKGSGGLGIGVTLAKKVVTRLGGEFGLPDPDDEDVTFHIVLPAEVPDAGSHLCD